MLPDPQSPPLKVKHCLLLALASSCLGLAEESWGQVRATSELF